MDQFDASVLDELSVLVGAASDAELARKLDISTAAMSKLRGRSSNMSAMTRLKALHLLGYEWAGVALKAMTAEGFASHVRAKRKSKSRK